MLNSTPTGIFSCIEGFMVFSISWGSLNQTMRVNKYRCPPKIIRFQGLGKFIVITETWNEIKPVIPYRTLYFIGS